MAVRPGSPQPHMTDMAHPPVGHKVQAPTGHDLRSVQRHKGDNPSEIELICPFAYQFGIADVIAKEKTIFLGQSLEEREELVKVVVGKRAKDDTSAVFQVDCFRVPLRQHTLPPFTTVSDVANDISARATLGVDPETPSSLSRGRCRDKAAQPQSGLAAFLAYEIAHSCLKTRADC